MTNQPKRKKKRSLVRTLLYRFFTGLEILIKFCFFIPILLFMVWFSHKVDISGLFQGELAPREVANMLLAGDTVSNYDKMDERAVLELYVQNLPEEQVPETIALGSSRVLQLQQELGGGSFFNMGLSGASAMDVMNCFYLLDKEGKLNGDVIDGILMEEKKEVDKVIINSAELEKYFGKDKSPRQMKDQIMALLDDWKAKQPPELGKPEKKTDKSL